MSSTVSPEVTVLPNSPVSLGEPNILICFIDKFSPPVVNVTWLRNGQPVTTGVSETVFLPREDHLFRKFYYLTFLPTTEDVYDCVVDHWGLEEPLLKHWEFEEHTPLPETKENLVCALGLFVGIVGIIAGVVFIIKGIQLSIQVSFSYRHVCIQLVVQMLLGQYRLVNPSGQLRFGQPGSACCSRVALASVSFDSPDLKIAAQSALEVVLKCTTKMSLNEHFTNMLKNKQPMPVNIRASMQQQQPVPETED
ncbi:hypothetical protein NN561_001904 [Cricetulus griseus]